MLTVAYCRVSTKEQAEEGFSIEGQTQKIRDYCRLHDLGEPLVICDPGMSGKNTARPGLQRLLGMVDAGEVDHVVIWRLDRLSRNLGDLILLADRFGVAEVGLHSITENIDLSSATGRMFFNILGSFAQFFREQLSENVIMGQTQAKREGRCTNRPPMGYSIGTNGILEPNHHAATVARIFDLRSQGMSYATIEAATGVPSSNVSAILKRRTYVGEIEVDCEWLPGLHDPIVGLDVFEAVQLAFRPGIRRGEDLMSSKVRCELCGGKMSVDQNGQGQKSYRCKHRGKGCKLSSRSARGLLAAAELGIRLACEDDMRTAIRRHLEERRRGDGVTRRRTPGAADAAARLRHEEEKLLRLYYDGKITDDLFHRDQARIGIELENVDHDLQAAEADRSAVDQLLADFDKITTLLDRIGFQDLWDAATDDEKRTLLDEFVDTVTVGPEHLTVYLHGIDQGLRIAFGEVGLRHSENSQEVGGTRTPAAQGPGSVPAVAVSSPQCGSAAGSVARRAQTPVVPPARMCRRGGSGRRLGM